MSILLRIRLAIAKERLKHLEYQAFLFAGKETTPALVKAQELRKKYGLQDWQYETNY